MKILIIRFSSIGDIVLTTPVIRAIKEQIPTTEIHYLTKKSFLSILENNPNISKVHTIEKSINECISLLKNENFNYVIDLHKNIRTFRLKWKLGVKSFSFNKLNIEKWLLVKFKINKMPDIHIVDRYFQAVEKLGVHNKKYACQLIISRQQVVNTQDLFDLRPKSFVAVAIGAQFATKTLPVEKLIDILSQVEYPIILLGGPGDVERSKLLIEGLKNHSQKVINAVNQFSLMQSASIVEQAKVLLTHDTGLMHIATAFNTPIVSVWGNTVKELGMYPYFPDNDELFSIHEVPKLDCRPCSKIGYAKCPKKHFNCMMLQDTKKIAEDLSKRMVR